MSLFSNLLSPLAPITKPFTDVLNPPKTATSTTAVPSLASLTQSKNFFSSTDPFASLNPTRTYQSTPVPVQSKPTVPATNYTPAPTPSYMTPAKAPMTPAPNYTPAPSANYTPVPGPQAYSPAPNYTPAPTPAGTVSTPTGTVVNPNTGGVVSSSPTVPSYSQPNTAASAPAVAAASTSSSSGASTASAPAMVSNSAYGPSPDVSSAESAYKNALGMTPDEEQVNTDLRNLETSYRTAYANTADQPIPLEFITGRQASLERRQLNLAQPLKDKAALLQAKRVASLDAAKFSLERADKAVERTTDANKPISVGSGSSLIQLDPATGKYKSIFSSPTATKRETSLTEAGGRRLLIDTQTGATIVDLGSTADNADYNRLLTVDEAQKLGVPYGSTVNDAVGASPKNDQTSQQAVAALEAVQSLANLPGLSAAVGLKGPTNWIPGTPAADFKAQLDRVKSLLTLPALQQLRGLGAMSDREFATLSTSVAALNPSMSESAFRAELTRIQGALQTTVNGTSSQSANGGWGW